MLFFKKSPKQFFESGKAKGDCKDYAGAIKDLDQAIALDPHYADAYAFRGMAQYELGEVEKGLEDMNQALRLNPALAYLSSARGRIRSQLGDYGMVQKLGNLGNRPGENRPIDLMAMGLGG